MTSKGFVHISCLNAGVFFATFQKRMTSCMVRKRGTRPSTFCSGDWNSRSVLNQHDRRQSALIFGKTSIHEYIGLSVPSSDWYNFDYDPICPQGVLIGDLHGFTHVLIFRTQDDKFLRPAGSKVALWAPKLNQAARHAKCN
jgi:hypothetical protein